MSALKVDDLGRVLLVEYDYEYQDNSKKLIRIKRGEEYVLIKKSNNDWWQVIKLGWLFVSFKNTVYKKKLIKFVVLFLKEKSPSYVF